MKKCSNLLCNTKLILLAVLACIVVNVQANQDNDPVRYYMQTNQFAKAKTLLLKELDNKTLTPDRIYLLGKIYLDEQQQDSAAIIFNAMNINIEEQRLLKLAGISRIDLKSVSKAEINLRLSRELKAINSSKSALVKLEAAYVFAQVNESEKASDLIEQACNLKPVTAETFVSAGDVYAHLSIVLKDNSLYGKACGRYEQALLLNKNYLPATTALAKAYMNSRNYFEAKQKLTDALAIDSTWLPALQLMGELQYTLGNYRLASKYYGDYIQRINPGKAQLQKYAYILYFNQEYSKAKKLIQALLKEDSENCVLLRLLAYTSCELKEPDEGLQAMEKFMKIKQSGDSLSLISSDFEYYGSLLSMKSLDSIAVIQFNIALQYDSTRLSVYESLAKLYEKQKDYQGAIRAYTVLTLKNPECNSTVWFSRGRNCLLLAETQVLAADQVNRNHVLDAAVSSFSKVSEISPNSHLGFLWKGRALAALDPETTIGLAEESYRSAISILEAKGAPEKYKSELIEAYSYMGYLYYLKFEQAIKGNHDAASSIRLESLEFWNKILAIDKSNQAAVQAVKALK